MILLFVYRVCARALFVLLGISASCRYTKSCSNHAERMIRKHGTIDGLLRAIPRVVRCHPWSRE